MYMVVITDSGSIGFVGRAALNAADRKAQLGMLNGRAAKPAQGRAYPVVGFWVHEREPPFVIEAVTMDMNTDYHK
jgi:hypothetical protein